jgi:hypothetical protein
MEVTYQFMFRHFTPWERATFIHWIGSWVGPVDGLVMVTEEEHCIVWQSNSDRPARS